MRRLRILLGIPVIAASAVLAACGSTEAQGTAGSAGSGWRPVRNHWEQRVLKRGGSEATGLQRWKSQIAQKRQGEVQSPLRQASAVQSPVQSPVQHASSEPAAVQEASAEHFPVSQASAKPNPVRQASVVMESSTAVSAGEVMLDEVGIVPEGMRPDLMPMEASSFGAGACSSCGSGFGPSGVEGCGNDCGPNPCNSCWGGPWYRDDWGWLRQVSLFAGVQGFKGPPDFGINGNFGFHEGVNVGGPLGGPAGIGFQAGFQAVHSNFSGYQTTGVMDRGNRNQFFVTAGLFRRALYGGIQWGGVFDYLHDSYYETIDVTQIRAEISWLDPHFRWELGFWGAFGTGDDRIAIPVAVRTEPTDMFAFFLRRQFSAGGQGRIWTGFTGEGDAIIGGDCSLPISASWAVEGNFNYVVPADSIGFPGQQEEGWGMALQLVWYPGRDARRVNSSPFHPLLSVADNSVFLVHGE